MHSAAYEFFRDQGSVIAGSLGFGAAIFAVMLTVYSERRRGNRELASLRRALGVEIRQYTANAFNAHCQCKAMIVRRNPEIKIAAIQVEDKAKLPPPQVFPNAVVRIGDFGTCAPEIILFFNRVAVTREAAERLLRHPSADNLPSGEIARAVEGLINISEGGLKLMAFLKTGIKSEDDTDTDAIKSIEAEAKDWATRRRAFGINR